MIAKLDTLRRKRRLERLALIKERHRKLIIEPRRQIELELAEIEEDQGFDIGFDAYFN